MVAVKRRLGSFDAVVIGTVLLCLPAGMTYLHGQHILHLDLKPENILLSMSGNVRICDFGSGYGFSSSNSRCFWLVCSWFPEWPGAGLSADKPESTSPKSPTSRPHARSSASPELVAPLFSNSSALFAHTEHHAGAVRGYGTKGYMPPEMCTCFPTLFNLAQSGWCAGNNRRCILVFGSSCTLPRETELLRCRVPNGRRVSYLYDCAFTMHSLSRLPAAD